MASTFISLPISGSTITGPIDVNVSAANDSIKISDGTDILAINADGSINIAGSTTVSGSVDAVITGLNEYEYSEALAVAAGGTATVVSHFFATTYKLRRASCTGENVAVYTVYFDAVAMDKKRSTYTDFNCCFDYETGIEVPAGTTVTIEVENASTSAGDFSAQLLFSPR
jgi:hypothetical protein